jgi:hypothetical protein
MNSNLNRGSSRKERKMKAQPSTNNPNTRRTQMNKNLILTLLASLLAMTATAAEPPLLPPMDEEPTLPFAIKLTETQLADPPQCLWGRTGVVQDYPPGFTLMEGDVWVIYKNGDEPVVLRSKGPTLEELVNQPGGWAGKSVGSRQSIMGESRKEVCRRPYILGGIWYSAADEVLYAPMHCEYYGIGRMGGLQRQIHLATSADKGLTWNYEGPIFTRTDLHADRATSPLYARAAECSGRTYDGGHGDHHLFTDETNGYHYVFSNYYVFNKPSDSTRAPLVTSRHQVARCAIADKMAPGKWRKFYNGKWEEPGVGGKASYVNGYCVTYNTYLKKYLSFDWGGGLAVCDDIARQDWTPIFKIPGAAWGFGDERSFLAWLVANEDKTDQNVTGQSFYVYSGFPMRKHPVRIIRQRLEFSPGQTRPTEGFIASGTKGWQTGGGPSANPDCAYPVPTILDSPDPIESRRTIAPQPGEVTFQGEWKAGSSDKPGSAVRCVFKAEEIYYRCWAGPDCGRADVFLDGVRAKTLDCWSREKHNRQFGFIKTHLHPTKDHTLEIRVRGDKHPLSTGTIIRAGAFEYSADCYRASDGFSSIQGKNRWRYEQKRGGALVDMTYENPITYANLADFAGVAKCVMPTDWTGDGKCAIGIDHQTPDINEVARTWTAPHGGVVRLQGNVGGRDSVLWDPLIVYVDDETKSEAAKAPAKPDPKATVEARILKNGEALWTARVGGAAHDVRVAVKTGDVIAFSTKQLAVAGRPEK